MDEVYQELIEAKLTLAETNEMLLMKSKQVKELNEMHSKQVEEVKKMQEEIQSLYDSISQISEERDLLLQTIQESPRAFSIQSLDLVADRLIDTNYTQGSRELWKTISENWSKVKTSKKMRNLSKKGIHSDFRGVVWKHSVENKLFINERLYTSLIVKLEVFELPSEFRRNLQANQIESVSKLLHCFLVNPN
jgi:hypothetical protein